MANCDVQTLLNNAACFACLPPGTLSIVELQLLCEILNSSGGTGSGTGTLAGTVTPNGNITGAATGQFYVDTANQTIWVFTGTVGTNMGWVQYV